MSGQERARSWTVGLLCLSLGLLALAVPARAANLGADAFLTTGASSVSGYGSGTFLQFPFGSTAIAGGVNNGISLSGSLLNVTGADYAAYQAQTAQYVGLDLDLYWSGDLQDPVNSQEYLNVRGLIDFTLTPGSNGDTGTVTWALFAQAGNQSLLASVSNLSNPPATVGPFNSMVTEPVDYVGSGQMGPEATLFGADLLPQADSKWDVYLGVVWSGFDADSQLSVTVPADSSIDEFISEGGPGVFPPLPEPAGLGVLGLGVLLLRRRRTGV